MFLFQGALVATCLHHHHKQPVQAKLGLPAGQRVINGTDVHAVDGALAHVQRLESYVLEE